MNIFNRLEVYQNKVAKAKRELRSIYAEIDVVKEDKLKLEAEIVALQNKAVTLETYADLGQTYIPVKNCDEMEIARAVLQDKVLDCLSDGGYRIEREITLNNSVSKGKTMQKAYAKGLMYSLSAYIDSKEKNVTLSNYDESCRLIAKKFDQLQHKANTLFTSLNKEYVDCRLEMLLLKAQIKEQKKIEREKERREREILKEEQKLLEEAEKERQRLKAEREAMDIAFARALTDRERQSIKDKLAKIDKRLADIDYRINNPKAGYLYIISSPSLPNMVKIGVTRRLNPAIRVKELSSSSLPFPFELNAYCFNNNAFELEVNIHNHFDAYRVSPNREFFYITVEQAVNVLKNRFNQEIHYGLYEENNESEETTNDA